MRGLIFLFFAAGLTAPAMAATPASTKPAGAGKPAGALPLAAGTRRITLSAEGNATAQKIMGTPDPRLVQIQSEMGAIQEEQKNLIVGPKIDVDKLETLLRKREALQAEVRTRSNDRMIALLRALGDPDRVALLQNLANPAQLQNSKSPPAPQPSR